MGENKYGTATVGYGTAHEREIPVKNFFRMVYSDNRLLSVSELENNEGFVVSVENPVTSGRNPIQIMWLSEESFYAVFSTIGLYLAATDRDIADKITNIGLTNDEIFYEYSDNITNPFKKDTGETL